MLNRRTGLVLVTCIVLSSVAAMIANARTRNTHVIIVHRPSRTVRGASHYRVDGTTQPSLRSYYREFVPEEWQT